MVTVPLVISRWRPRPHPPCTEADKGGGIAPLARAVCNYSNTIGNWVAPTKPAPIKLYIATHPPLNTTSFRLIVHFSSDNKSTVVSFQMAFCYLRGIMKCRLFMIGNVTSLKCHEGDVNIFTEALDKEVSWARMNEPAGSVVLVVLTVDIVHFAWITGV